MRIVSLFSALLLITLLIIFMGVRPSCAPLTESVTQPFTEPTTVETVIKIIDTKEVQIHFNNFTYIEFNSVDECYIAIEELQSYNTWLMSELIREYTDAENFLEIYDYILDEYNRINVIIDSYENNIQALELDALWSERKQKYPTATQIWLFFKDELGWSDAICAGVMGNLMAEAGGQTLKIQWNIWDKSGGYYGICQWAIKYTPTIANQSLENQLLHIKNTVEKTMNNWGRKYEKDFNYEKFIALEDPKEVALAFAKCYERCSSKHYNIRTINAMKAYEYFTSDTRE